MVILQVFDLNGIPQFYEFSAERTMVRVGRADGNDVVIEGPGIADFHLVLYCQQEPYRVVALSRHGNLMVDGAFLPPNIATPFTNASVIRVANYELRLLGGASPSNGGPMPPPALPATGPEGEVYAAYVAPPQETRGVDLSPTSPMLPYRADDRSLSPHVGPAAPDSRSTFFADKRDDIIQVDLLGFPDTSRILKVDAGQENSFQVSITNNGERNAEFIVEVDGLGDWCYISGGGKLEIYKRETGIAFVTVTPPRSPSSRTGTYHFAIKVTSPRHYPGHFSQYRATLIVNPYYEFSVGELSPKKLTLPWHRRSGETTLTITNKANSHAMFQVEGQDDEHACNFEFQTPEEAVPLSRQAELRLPPDSTTVVPVRITPYSRPFLRFGSRSHKFTVTTALLEGHHTPRILAGELVQKPLIGRGMVILLALLLLVAVAFFFRPTLRTFKIHEGGKEIAVRNGTPAALYWQGSPFTVMRIEPEPTSGLNPLPAAEGTVVAWPRENTVYTLRGENWLSRLIPSLFEPDPQMVRIVLTPIAPNINFSVQPEQVVAGQGVALNWQVAEAEKVTLLQETNGVQEVIPLNGDQQQSGRMTVPDISLDTVFILQAENSYAQATPVARPVRVITPTPPPVPTPVVKKFIVYPTVVVAGTPVIIEWEVEGADSVSVQPIGGELPLAQSVNQSPLQTTNYVLNASYQGAKIPSLARQVFVTPAPSPTLEPEAPVIEYFTAAPAEVVKDSDDTVNLAWSIKGVTTDVQLSGPNFGTMVNLNPQGSMIVPVNESIMFILTAFNGDKKSSANAQIKVNTPTPTTTPQPTATPRPTSTATPVPPNIVYFRLQPTEKIIPLTGNTYQVIAGAKGDFVWSVQNASQVTLYDANGQSLGNQPLDGTWSQTIKQGGVYRLVARNIAGQTDEEALQIELETDPPPAPYNIQGTLNSSGQLTIEWDYERTYENQIDSFTIYRLNGFDKESVARDISKQTRSYQVPFVCNQFYVVVAVYTDLDGNIQESGGGQDSQVNSWFSGPCP